MEKMKKLTLGQAHKYCKAIWKWLSENSDPELSTVKNKEKAIAALGIEESFFYDCPYCEYDNQQKNEDCSSCPIQKKYPVGGESVACYKIGYLAYENYPSRANAKKFYNKIKDL